MNTATFSLASLRFHALSNIFNIVVLALGIATIITLLRVSDQIEDRFDQDLNGIDLVVGAKGSPLQLILSSVFHLDVPTGNIPLKDAEELEKNPLIKSAIPVALGDSYHGFRIVGTTPDYPRHYNASLSEGHLWTHAMETVLGSEVARRSGLTVGAHFVGSHGLTQGGEEHSDFPYTVTGILAPTGSVVDRLIFTDISSVWNVHEHHHDDDDDHEEKSAGREITALLITYKSPLAAATLPRLINNTSSLQAASPALELAKLYHLIGAGSEAIRFFGIVLMAVAGIGFFVTLFHAASDRRYDIALLRALGATRAKIFAFMIIEGLILGALGTVLGIMLGHLMTWGIEVYIQHYRHMTLTNAAFTRVEFYIAFSALGVALAASIIPAWIACKTNVAALLARSAS